LCKQLSTVPLFNQKDQHVGTAKVNSPKTIRNKHCNPFSLAGFGHQSNKAKPEKWVEPDQKGT
jgi:hypothetical protein